MDCEDIEFSKNKYTEEIVISGIAGRYPESDNILDLGRNLIAKKDMITEDDRRWKCGVNYFIFYNLQEGTLLARQHFDMFIYKIENFYLY